MENQENNKIKVIIIGAGPEDKIGTSHIALYIEKLQKTHEVIFVDSIEKAQVLTGLDIGKMPMLDVEDINNIHNNKKIFDNPPTYIRRLPELPALKEPFFDLKESHPWPSPKGKRGKRKW